MAEYRAAHHIPGEQLERLWAILGRARRLSRHAGQIQNRRGISLPRHARYGSAQRGPQPDGRPLTARGGVVAEGQRIWRDTPQLRQNRHEIAGGVAP
jgi:hypothetical protein